MKKKIDTIDKYNLLTDRDRAIVNQMIDYLLNTK